MIHPRTHAKAMWESGEYTMRDICAACGVEASVVRTWKREDAWRTDFEPAALDPGVRSAAIDLFDAGETISAIARELGVHRKTIQRWLEGRYATTWRCNCTEYGRVVRGPACACGRRAPFL